MIRIYRNLIIIVIFSIIISLPASNIYPQSHIDGTNKHIVYESDKLRKKNIDEIKKGKHGYIQIVFPDFRGLYNTKAQYYSGFGDNWSLSLFANEFDLYFGEFLSYERNLFPVPVGEITIKYLLLNMGHGPSSVCTDFFTCENYHAKSYGTYGIEKDRGWWDQDNIFKTLTVKVEEGKIIKLNVQMVSDPTWGMGCCFLFPFPFKLQDVEFKIGAIEDAAPYE